MNARPHRYYRVLFSICLLVMASLALPGRWNRLASPGYLVLALSMIVGLGRPLSGESLGRPARHLYRGLGILTIAVGVLWSLTPVEHRDSGIPLILLWSLFSVWSSLRLVRSLAGERRVSPPVITGAFAGYLMLGLTSGLLCSTLETIHPGSFIDLQHSGSPLMPHNGPVGLGQPVWMLNFVRLNYFAFVSLTTMGYGDVLPATPQAQMLGVLIATMGTFYVAVVMGLLISRIIANEAGRH
ncbi:MAG: potassium channel family protein [Cyanobium sp.]